MSVPNTYLLTVPDAKDDPFGRCISSMDIVTKLKKINSLIVTEEQFSSEIWFPGKSLGITCMWYKAPGMKRRKLTAIRHGPVPEWTQLDDKGEIITKGWRRIFQKVVKSGAVKALDIEKAFSVSLDFGEKDPLCSWCRKSNKTVRATSSTGHCDMHMRVLAQVEHARQVKQEKRYQRRIA